MSRLDNFNKKINSAGKSFPRKPSAKYVSFNKKVWKKEKEETRKTTNACPEGYLDFTTGLYGEPRTQIIPIPNNCIEFRARIRKFPSNLNPGPKRNPKRRNTQKQPNT